MIPAWKPLDEAVDALITMQYGDRWLREDSPMTVASARTEHRLLLVAALGPQIDALMQAGSAMASLIESYPVATLESERATDAWTAACAGMGGASGTGGSQ